jgi:hypothetical protein
MDGRDQPDTNVVRIRRSGDPSEAERRRLASTIFAEEDDVGTFSRGNLVPPPTDHPTEPRDDDRANAADPYFERLQRTRGGHRQIATAARSDSETIAYFDRLATQSPAEMSANGTPSPAATPMPGSALLPAELTRPSRHRSRRHDRLIPFAPAIRLWATLRRSRLAWPLSTATLGVLAALGAGIAVIGQTSSRGSKQRLSQHAAGATFLAPIRQDVLAASVDPFGAKAVVLGQSPTSLVRIRLAPRL